MEDLPNFPKLQEEGLDKIFCDLDHFIKVSSAFHTAIVESNHKPTQKNFHLLDSLTNDSVDSFNTLVSAINHDEGLDFKQKADTIYSLLQNIEHNLLSLLVEKCGMEDDDFEPTYTDDAKEVILFYVDGEMYENMLFTENISDELNDTMREHITVMIDSEKTQVQIEKLNAMTRRHHIYQLVGVAVGAGIVGGLVSSLIQRSFKYR